MLRPVQAPGPAGFPATFQIILAGRGEEGSGAEGRKESRFNSAGQLLSGFHSNAPTHINRLSSAFRKPVGGRAGSEGGGWRAVEGGLLCTWVVSAPIKALS